MKNKKSQMNQQEVTAIVVLAIILIVLGLVFFYAKAKVFLSIIGK